MEQLTCMIEELYDYWMSGAWGNENSMRMWMRRGREKDEEISSKYRVLYNTIKREIKTGDIRSLTRGFSRTGSRKVYVGLVLLLDQVPRHLYRTSCYAFKTDSYALQLACMLLINRNVNGKSFHLTMQDTFFLSLPFQHSQNIKVHRMFIDWLKKKITRTTCIGTISMLKDVLYYAEKHKQVIQRFGRYPKRGLQCKWRLTREEVQYIENENKGLPF